MSKIKIPCPRVYNLARTFLGSIFVLEIASLYKQENVLMILCTVRAIIARFIYIVMHKLVAKRCTYKCLLYTMNVARYLLCIICIACFVNSVSQFNSKPGRDFELGLYPSLVKLLSTLMRLWTILLTYKVQATLCPTEIQNFICRLDVLRLTFKYKKHIKIDAQLQCDIKTHVKRKECLLKKAK